MRVAYLELQDIKSYARTTRIELTDGVNAICGANGSGKTTMLEAIGLALFDFAPYSQSAFVREGQKSGTIRVGLEGRDQRLYEVVRRIGSGAAYFVADAETGERIAERNDAVRDWILRQALDIDAGTNLESLFKNAIGVPQGLMTADFQNTPSARKAVFDPLLRVEEYRQAYEELRNTVNVLRDRTHAVDNEISALRTDADRIPAKAEAIERLQERVRAAEAELADEEQYLARQEAARAVLDQLAQQVLELTTALRDAQYELTRLSDLVAGKNAEVERARESVRIVEETRESDRLYREAGSRLRELQSRNEKRQDLKSRLSGVQATRESIFGQIEALDRDLRAAEDASKEAEALRPRVQQQEQLEREGAALELVMRDLKGLRDDETRVRRERQSLEDARRGRERELVSARWAAERAEQLPAAQERLTELAGQLALLEPIKAQQNVLKKEGASLREERLNLLDQIKQRGALAAQLSECEPLAHRLESLVSAEIELREARARTQAAIEYHDLARAELSRARCPLLEVECPVVSSDRRSLERFDERALALRGDLKRLDGELSAIKPQLSAARTASSTTQTVREELAKLDGLDAALIRTEERLRHCLDEFARMSRALDEGQELRREQTELHARTRELQSAGQLAATLPMLERQQEEDARVLADKQSALANLAARIEELGPADERAVELKRELAVLGDPREEARRFAGIAGRGSEIEQSIVEAQGRLADAAARVKALVAALEQYSSLDAEMGETHRLESDHAEGHELFMRHQGEAASLPERSEALQSLQASRDVAEQARSRAQAALAEAEITYDAVEHARLKQECEEAMRRVIQRRERLAGAGAELSRLEDEMAMLRRAESKLRILESDREGLVRTARTIAFIRDTIRSAGPAITETLLRHISEGASDIYSEIIDDHAAELRWDREYEVLVQRGSDTRKFAQLSGGEQMSAALAVRLALLKEMSEVDFAFFDEPTQNMDGERRTNLAGQIQQLRGFNQLIVISHDDTFEHHTDNLIRLSKEQEETRIETFAGEAR